eukprot:g43890.t1
MTEGANRAGRLQVELPAYEYMPLDKRAGGSESPAQQQASASPRSSVRDVARGWRRLLVLATLMAALCWTGYVSSHPLFATGVPTDPALTGRACLGQCAQQPAPYGWCNPKDLSDRWPEMGGSVACACQAGCGCSSASETCPDFCTAPHSSFYFLSSPDSISPILSSGQYNTYSSSQDSSVVMVSGAFAEVVSVPGGLEACLQGCLYRSLCRADSA